MREIYRKFGRVARFEHGMWIDVREAGEAIESGETFIATPLREPVELPSPALPDLVAADTLVRRPRDGAAHAARADAAVRLYEMRYAERLIVASGIAIHRFGDLEWREETRRLHVSLAHQRIRALIDLDEFDFDLVNRVADRLARAASEREAPPRIRLAPHVAAALLPQLVGVAPPNIELWQRAGGRDGKGQLIDEVPASQASNWFRPSYRVRPIRKPMNLAAVCGVTEIDGDLPQAIALLAPPDGLTLRVLVDDGRDVYPSSLRIVRIDAVAPDGEMML